MKYLSVIGGLLLSFAAMGVNAQDPEFHDIWDPDYIRNADLVHYAEGIDRYMVEVASGESAQVQKILEYDFERLKSYSSEMRSEITLIFTEDRADFPYSSDMKYALTYQSEGMDFGEVTNEDLRWVLRWFANMMVQATRSDSANVSNGISQFDYSRQVIALDRLDAFLLNYEENALPRDLPQHSKYEIDQRRGQ